MNFKADELIKKTNEELYEIIKGLSLDNRRVLWNTVAETDTKRLKSLNDYLKTIKIPKVVQSGKRAGKNIIAMHIENLYNQLLIKR